MLSRPHFSIGVLVVWALGLTGCPQRSDTNGGSPLATSSTSTTGTQEATLEEDADRRQQLESLGMLFETDDEGRVIEANLATDAEVGEAFDALAGIPFVKRLTLTGPGDHRHLYGRVGGAPPVRNV